MDTLDKPAKKKETQQKTKKQKIKRNQVSI
jgi:hypothetical protein